VVSVRGNNGKAKRGLAAAAKRAAHARRQAAYRAREAAKVAAMKAELASRDEVKVAPDVLRVLDDIRARVTALQRQGPDPLLLRKITAIERHLGLIETPAAPRASRRQPLGIDS
jgi:hypothetical protein